jgi:hypothetical protein
VHLDSLENWKIFFKNKNVPCYLDIGGQSRTGGGQPWSGSGGQPGSGRTGTGSQTGNLLFFAILSR